MKCAQHAARNPQFENWDYSDNPGGGHKKIKVPHYIVEGGHHLTKPPTPTHSS